MATVRKRTRATRKDGSVPIVVNYTDQYGKRRQKTFPTVKAAENWKIETQKAVKDGTHTPDHGSITLLQPQIAGLTMAKLKEFAQMSTSFAAIASPTISPVPQSGE